MITWDHRRMHRLPQSQALEICLKIRYNQSEKMMVQILHNSSFLVNIFKVYGSFQQGFIGRGFLFLFAGPVKIV